MRRISACTANLLSFPLIASCTVGELSFTSKNPAPTRDSQLERDILACDVSDGQAHCAMVAKRLEGRKKRFKLRATRTDLEKYGLTVIGWTICAISDRSGYHCTNIRTGEDATPAHARPMSQRSWVAWNDGLCVESSIRDERSHFECFHRSGHVRQTTEFFVSEHHRTVSFESGACICSDQRDYFQGDGETPLGAACLFQDDDISVSASYTQRDAEGLTHGVMMRGPGFYLDFGEVCRQLEGNTPAEATARLEAWESGRRDLPPTVGLDPPYPGPETVVEVPSTTIAPD